MIESLVTCEHDSLPGNLYTETPLDREFLPVHSLKVSVTDEGGRASFTTVRVTVQDRNDNPPVFTLPEYQANTNTDVAPGTTILRVRSSDEAGPSHVAFVLSVDNLTYRYDISLLPN